jgi:hypothetical protein
MPLKHFFSMVYTREFQFIKEKREREAMSEKRRWQQLLSNSGGGRSCFI